MCSEEGVPYGTQVSSAVKVGGQLLLMDVDSFHGSSFGVICLCL